MKSAFETWVQAEDTSGLIIFLVGHGSPDELIDKAKKMPIGRAVPIIRKPLPTMGEVVGEITLDSDSTAEIWVRGVRDAEGVRATIIPPHIEPVEGGGPITDQFSIELSDSDGDGTYEGSYDDFTMQGSYLIVIKAYTSTVGRSTPTSSAAACMTANTAFSTSAVQTNTASAASMPISAFCGRPPAA